ncbi:hypothetical protein DBR06_SOUSAS4710035, partial [Sousa chinensis]
KMSCGFFSEDIYPTSYWGSCGYPLGCSIDYGYGSSYSPVGYGFGCIYGTSQPLDYRRYWTFDLY